MIVIDKLNILWTNDNPQTAHTMVFMYAINSKLNNWWDEVLVIIWGSTAKLVAEDETIQHKIEIAKEAGVSVVACISCANQFGVTEKIKSLGIELKPMGKPLTDIIKSGEKLITI